MTDTEAQARAVVTDLIEHDDHYGIYLTELQWDTLEKTIAAALRQAQPVWTREKPTEPGWYWWHGAVQTIVHIYKHRNGHLVVDWGEFESNLVDEDGQWARVPEPREAP